MTITLNASTASGLVVTPDNSGNIVLQYNGVAAPAFSAYLNSTQYPTAGDNTVVQCDTKEFDTANCYNTSTYRFTPTVAGYYQINGQISARGATSITRIYVGIMKNGSIVRYGNDVYVSSGSMGYKVAINTLIYMNGTTDYLQLFGAVTASSAQFTADGSLSNYFQGCLLRGA